MEPKPRLVHPGDPQDERLAGLALAAAYTYAYLPTVLDDAGRGKDQPALLNGRLWPLRADEHPTAAMAADLAALAEAGLVCRYTAEGQAYLHLPDWADRQADASAVAGSSSLPACPVHEVPGPEAARAGAGEPVRQGAGEPSGQGAGEPSGAGAGQAPRGERVEDVFADTFGRLSEQVGAFLDEAAASLDEAHIRDTLARVVEDVTFLVDAERAAAYGEKVREFLSRGRSFGPWPSATPPEERTPPDPEGSTPPAVPPGDTWRETTDDPTGE